jgi:HSF-type DNA-binding
MLVLFTVYKDRAWIEQQKNEMQEQLKTARGHVQEQFPLKLYRMLESVNDSSHSKIVSWQSYGRAFKVHDKEKFASEVIPEHFPSLGGFPSFQRQLNIYGFLRLISDGPDQGAYYHELFVRSQLDLCELIQRNETSTHSVRCTYDGTTEPNFAAYPCLPDCRASVSSHPVTESSSSMKDSLGMEDDDAWLGSMIDKWIAHDQLSYSGAQPVFQDSLQPLSDWEDTMPLRIFPNPMPPLPRLSLAHSLGDMQRWASSDYTNEATAQAQSAMLQRAATQDSAQIHK